MKYFAPPSGKPTVEGPNGEQIFELARGEQQSVVYVKIPPGGSSQMHYHNDVEEVYMVVRGLGKLTIGTSEQILSPGSSTLIEPHDVHIITNIHDDSWLEFWCTCAPPWTPDCLILVDEKG